MKTRIAHAASLPTQAVRLFRELRLLTGADELCFPGRHSASQCISDMALLNGIRRMGFSKEEMTIHGFRAMFSTILNEKKPEWALMEILSRPNLPSMSRMPFAMLTIRRTWAAGDDTSLAYFPLLQRHSPVQGYSRAPHSPAKSSLHTVAGSNHIIQHELIPSDHARSIIRGVASISTIKWLS